MSEKNPILRSCPVEYDIGIVVVQGSRALFARIW